MRKNSHASAFKRLSLFVWVMFLLVSPCGAQKKQTPQPLPSEPNAARVSIEDGLSLLEKIKEVESPTFRAYLNTNVAVWLWQSAGEDETLRRAAVDAAARGVADLQRHEHEIPPAPANVFYEKLLNLVRRHSPEEAAKLEHAHPLRAKLNRSEQEKAGGQLYEALRKLDNPQTSAQGLEEALRLINSGAVPMTYLHGQLIVQAGRNPSALPQLLSATLALEERSAGFISLHNLFFLSMHYLRETTPAELRARFLAASVAATRRVTAEQRSDPRVFNWAVQLLRTVLPHLRKSNHPLYGEAAARLANFAPGAAREDEVFERIRESADPLATMLDEAEATSDKAKKRLLLGGAAGLARRQGKFRRAADLISSIEDERAGAANDYSSRDVFLGGIVQDALAQKDTEAARYAASKIQLPVNRALASQRLARYSFEQKDAQAVNEHLSDAVKALRDAPEGTSKAVAYLRLTEETAELDAARAPEMLKEALKAANAIPRPREAKDGEFSWKLFPLADALTKTFRRLSSTDRATANGLTGDLQPKELKVAALLGVYGGPSK